MLFSYLDIHVLIYQNIFVFCDLKKRENKMELGQLPFPMIENYKL